jgi:hypothetical protein
MLSTLALTAALTLTPGQAGGELKLTNVRPTYGFLGAPRPDTEILPGDAYYISFDIENLTVKDDGEVRYSMSFQLSMLDKDEKAKVVFRKDPEERTAYNSLGGNRQPAFTVAEFGTDSTPGKYRVEVVVTDLESKKNAKLTRDVKLLDKDFGLARLHLNYIHAPEQAPVAAPPFGAAGQQVVVNCAMVGFKRDPNTKQPNLSVEFRVLDAETKQPTLKKPITATVTKNVNPDFVYVPIQVPLTLNRPGKFTVELKATDVLAKKTKTITFPLEVRELK